MQAAGLTGDQDGLLVGGDDGVGQADLVRAQADRVAVVPFAASIAAVAAEA